MGATIMACITPECLEQGNGTQGIPFQKAAKMVLWYMGYIFDSCDDCAF